MFNHTLADIDNPHSVLLVCDRHTRLRQRLYVGHSMPALQEAGYGSFFGEQHPADEVGTGVMKTILQMQGLERSMPLLAEESVCLNLFHAYQAEACGLKYVFSDSKQPPGEMNNKTTIEEQAIIQQTVSDINDVISETAQEDENLFHLIANGATYAALGDKSFTNYLDTVSLTDDQITVAKKAGMIYRQGLQKKMKQKDKNLVLSERNYDYAGQMAQKIKRSPKTKIIGNYGASHITCGFGKTWEGSALLPDILRDKYGVKSTCVAFVTSNDVVDAHLKIAQKRLKAELIDPQEALPFSRPLFNASPVDVYFALTNKEVTQGIHALGRSAELENLDYVIGLPEMDNNAAIAYALADIKRLLKL